MSSQHGATAGSAFSESRPQMRSQNMQFDTAQTDCGNVQYFKCVKRQYTESEVASTSVPTRNNGADFSLTTQQQANGLKTVDRGAGTFPSNLPRSCNTYTPVDYSDNLRQGLQLSALSRSTACWSRSGQLFSPQTASCSQQNFFTGLASSTFSQPLVPASEQCFGAENQTSVMDELQTQPSSSNTAGNTEYCQEQNALASLFVPRNYNCNNNSKLRKPPLILASSNKFHSQTRACQSAFVVEKNVTENFNHRRRKVE